MTELDRLTQHIDCLKQDNADLRAERDEAIRLMVATIIAKTDPEKSEAISAMARFTIQYTGIVDNTTAPNL